MDVSDRAAPRLLSHYETVEQATGVDTADGNRRWVGAGNRMGDWEDTLTFSCRLPDSERKSEQVGLGRRFSEKA